MRYLALPERITDQTVRRRWEQTTKVNIRGERVNIAPEGPLAQAQWATIAQVISDLTLQRGLNQPLGQRPQQAALPGQPQPALTGPPSQPVDCFPSFISSLFVTASDGGFVSNQ